MAWPQKTPPPQTPAAAVAAAEDDGWNWSDDDDWDNLWRNSTASITNQQTSANFQEPSSKRAKMNQDNDDADDAADDHSMILWSVSNPTWLNETEAAAALNQDSEAVVHNDDDDDHDKEDHGDPDEEEAFPAGQGFDLSSLPQPQPPPSPIHSVLQRPTPMSTPMPQPPSWAKMAYSEWSWPSPPWLAPPGAASTPLPSHNVTKSKGTKSQKPAEDWSSLSWDDLVNRHSTLMAQKGIMDNRQFNKKAIQLLSAFAAHAPPQPQTGTNHSGASAAVVTSNGANWDSEKQALQHFRSMLLNQKEMASEELVARVVQYIEGQLSPLLTADEKKETLLKKSLAFMLELSPQLSIKTAPVIRSYVSRQFDAQLDNLFAEIRMPEMPLRDKALLYRRMFSNVFDDDRCVSFAACNKSLLGKTTIRDLYFLTFYACVTSRRHRGDNLLQLGCVGGSGSTATFFLT